MRLIWVTGQDLVVIVGPWSQCLNCFLRQFSVPKEAPPPSCLPRGRQGCQLPGAKQEDGRRGVLLMGMWPSLTPCVRPDPTLDSAYHPQVQGLWHSFYLDGMFIRGVG